MVKQEQMCFYLKTVDVGFAVVVLDCKGMLSLEMFHTYSSTFRSLPKVDDEEVLLPHAEEEVKEAFETLGSISPTHWRKVQMRW